MADHNPYQSPLADTDARFLVEDLDNTVVIEWDNRRFAKSKFLTISIGLFWIIWTPVTGAATWFAVTGINDLRGEALELFEIIFFSLWLTGAYLGVIGIPLRWLSRYARERVVLSPTEYRHYLVEFPWLFPKRWATSDITQIAIGRHGDREDYESIVTLNIRKGWRRDMLAYWLKNPEKYELFEIIAPHLQSLQPEIEIIDTLGRT